MARAIMAPSNLPELVKTTFARALADGELHYFPTQVALLTVGSVPFQLRFSPSLANKPKGPPSDPSRPPKPIDPFAHPPASLYVTDLGPSHYLVLNKFAVVPEHFILATKEFREQTHILDAADLESTLSCIEAYEHDNGGGLFAFFNCGEHSGASQPHRHIQLLPVSRMRDGLKPGCRWDVLADGDGLHSAPFAAFAEAIRVGMSASELHGAYFRLYRRACRAVSDAGGGSGYDDEALPAGESRISYNMAMTKNRIVICPRMSEGGAIYNITGGEEVGRLALNGTVLAGTALVKSEREWDALRDSPSGLVDVLRRIGLPRDDVSRI